MTTTTTTTTTKMTKYLKTEQITTEGMTGEGKEYGVEAAELPVSSPLRHAQRSREMGVIGRDGQEFRPRVEGEILPCRSGFRRPPTMVGRPRAGDCRTVTQTPYTTTPRGVPLGKFGSLGMMGADDGWAPPLRDATNLTPPPPHTFPPRGGP